MKTQILHGMCVCVCVYLALDCFSRLWAPLVVHRVNPPSLDCNAIYHSSPAQFRQWARRINNHEERWLLTSAATSDLSHTVRPHTSFHKPWASNSSWFFMFATGTQYSGWSMSLSLCMSVYVNMCNINMLTLLESKAAFVVIHLLLSDTK